MILISIHVEKCTANLTNHMRSYYKQFYEYPDAIVNFTNPLGAIAIMQKHVNTKFIMVI